MNHKEFLYFILDRALLELRDEGATIKNARVHYISHFLHNLPKKLKEANELEDFEKIFETLTNDAQASKMEKWYNSILEQYSDRFKSENKIE